MIWLKTQKLKFININRFRPFQVSVLFQGGMLMEHGREIG